MEGGLLRFVTSGVTALLFFVLAAAPAGAQRFPGAPGGDGLSAQANLAEYFADVIMNVNDVMTEWRGAWAQDDLETLADQYTEDATLVYGDEEPIRGREAIRTRLESILPSSGEVQAAMSDFDASGRMGMIAGFVTLEVREGSRSETRTGIHMTILIRRRGDWRIRSQIFRFDRP